jgi:hypothetical protein
MTILFHLDLLLVAQFTEKQAARLVEHPADLMPPYPPALSHPTGAYHGPVEEQIDKLHGGR